MAWLGTAGCVSPPSVRDVLDVGFRSPEQCWQSFQTAVRADEPALEYRCLSQRLIAERGLSQLVWREARAELYAPLGTRWAIAQARPLGPASVQGDRATLVVEALGRKVRLCFLREDFRSLLAGEQLLLDENADFASSSGVQTAADGQRWFYAQIPLPLDGEPDRISEMHLGREWKLDGISESGEF
jgi:hypothetical protein